MPEKITRRQVLSGATLAAGIGVTCGLGRNLSALASVTVGPRGKSSPNDALVVLFLRGGADGLNIVIPHGDDDYYRQRPTLALARPRDRRESQKARVLDLNGFFGLHPALAPLLPLYRNGQFAAVHAIGSGDQTRSHFEAMATMERGLAQQSGTASGWLARHLAATAQPVESPLRAVAISETMPDSLRGATNTTALTNLAEFRLNAPAAPTGTDGAVFHATTQQRAQALATTLNGLYSETSGDKTLAGAGRETLAAIDAVRRLDPAHYRPTLGANYPNNDLGAGLRQAACLVKGEVGMEIACLDMGGWDTHVGQGRDTGYQPARLADLGQSLAAFATDLGPRLDQVTILVMTEFGRRAYENSGLGTDHGRAGCMLLLGGGIVGGQVFARWPGLSKSHLDENGDLRVTTDYRDVLAEILVRRLNNPHIDQVFTEYSPKQLNIVKPV